MLTSYLPGRDSTARFDLSSAGHPLSVQIGGQLRESKARF